MFTLLFLAKIFFVFYWGDERLLGPFVALEKNKE